MQTLSEIRDYAENLATNLPYPLSREYGNRIAKAGEVELYEIITDLEEALGINE